MSQAAPALLLAAAGVGLGHAILPDHWVPLSVLGRSRRYSLAKVGRLAALAGIAHVLLSIVLGAVIVVIGLQFRSSVQSAQDTIIGCILIATGAGFALLDLTGHGHHHDHDHATDHDHETDHDHDQSHEHETDHDHDQSHEHETDHDHDQNHEHETDHETDHDHQRSAAGERKGLGGVAAVMVPFGAAASPDLTILPVFLAATTASVATAVGSVLVFAAVTIGTIVGLTLVATAGGYQFRGDWLERWGNTVTAAVLVVIGALVLSGVL